MEDKNKPIIQRSLIPNENRKGLACDFCHKTQSVKYKVTVNYGKDPFTGKNRSSVYTACNVCAYTHEFKSFEDRKRELFGTNDNKA